MRGESRRFPVAAPGKPMSALQDNEARSHRRAESGKQVSVIQDAISRHLLSSYCGLSTVSKGTVLVFREFLVRRRRGVCGRAVTGEGNPEGCDHTEAQPLPLCWDAVWSHCATHPPPSQLRTC